MIKIPNDMQAGTIHETNNYGDFKVIEYVNSKNVKVEFINTGYIATTQAIHIRAGNVKDYLARTVFSVGYIGAGGHIASVKGKVTKAYQTWQSMLRRCYCPKYQARQPTYIDCTVVAEWHSFQNFAEWFELNYVEGCHLDKDIKIKGNKVYSPATCSFVSQAQNTVEAHAKQYAFINPNGEAIQIYNLAKFCRENGLHHGNMAQVHLGKIASYKQWRASNA